MTTKTFPLRVLLTVTTDRLLTEPKDGGNGIGDLYDILGWMTNDSPFTHQLGRFGQECKPWLLKWFPEIAPASARMTQLDGWLERDRSGGEEGVKMWLTELKMMFPAIKDSYEVPRIPSKAHHPKDPVAELIELRESKEGIIIVNGGSAP
jgi:hypothetical protein